MTSQPIHERVTGDYTDAELRTVLATMAGRDPEQVCEVSAVLIMHGASGAHELVIMGDGGRPAAGIAAVLRHAAEHVTGTCKRCQKQARRLGHGDS
jgi:hypothetical protein